MKKASGDLSALFPLDFGLNKSRHKNSKIYAKFLDISTG
jgi:hypothetical protein